MILPIESIPIQVTTVAGEIILIQLDAPNGENPFYFQAEEVPIRGKYRDRNNILRKGETAYAVRWFYNYASHEMDLRYLLTAKSLQLATPPNFVGEYQTYDVRLVNQEVVKNYLGMPGGALTLDSYNTIPSGNITLEFELLNPIDWESLLALAWFQEIIPEEDEGPVAPTGLAVGEYVVPEYYTDFSEYSTGAQPSDWDIVAGAGTWTVETLAGTEGGQALRFTGETSGQHFLQWTELPFLKNVEVEARVMAESLGGSTRMRILGRLPNQETAYFAEITGFGGGQYSFWQALEGGFTNLYSSAESWSIDTWYRVKVNLNGNAVKFKIWEDGTSEPGTWDFEGTDDDLVRGRAGVAMRVSSSGDYHWVDWIKITNLDA